MFKYFNPNVVGGPTDNTIPIDAVNMQKGIVRAPIPDTAGIAVVAQGSPPIGFYSLTWHLQYPETDFATAKLNAAVSMARLQDIGPQIECVADRAAHRRMIGPLCWGGL